MIRLCDITAPGGYCTVYNCEPGSCPEDESLCVEFGEQRSPIDKCVNEQSPSPYARAFCMATCEQDSDCRDGYKCGDLRAGNAWDALLIDRDRGDRACMVPFKAGRVDDQDAPEGFGDVCTSELPAEAPEQTPDETPDDPSAGGASGQGGATGQGGAGG